MKYKLNFFTQLSVFLWYNHHSLPIQSPLYPINSHSVHIWNPHHILITSSSNPMKSQEIPRNPKKSLKIHPCLQVPASKSTYRTAEVFASSSLAEQQTPRAQLIRDTVSKASGAGEEQPILIWGWINTY